MAKRKSTGKRLRFNVFKRDRFTCQYCGRTPPTVVLVTDHILPVASGGETVEHNLITSCETCNQGKAAGLLTTVPESIALQLAKQVERHEQLREFNRFLLKVRRELDATAVEITRYWDEAAGNDPNDSDPDFNRRERLATFKRFLGLLPHAEVFEAVDIAMGRKPPTHTDRYTFKYFCGVCWNKIKEREGGHAKLTTLLHFCFTPRTSPPIPRSRR